MDYLSFPFLNFHCILHAILYHMHLCNSWNIGINLSELLLMFWYQSGHKNCIFCSSVLNEVTFSPILLWALFIRILLLLCFIIWLIKLIVQWNLYLFIYFFGCTVKINLLKSSSISPLLYIYNFGKFIYP